jgi:multidrug efflux pump subunit AcrB
MNLRYISAWAIRNPIVPIVLFIGLTLAGLVSFSRMDVNNSPDIDFPAVSVSISQPGAAPTEIETQITQKVEAAVRSVNGVDEIQSNAREGNSNTFVQFQIGINSDQAVNDVKNALDQIRGDLPDGILEPRVTKEEISGGPIGYFAVQADDMTMEQLSWFIDDTIARRLLSIEGMAAVSRAGGVDREIRVVLDPAKMQALGVTASALNQALRQVNVDAAGAPQRSRVRASRCACWGMPTTRGLWPIPASTSAPGAPSGSTRSPRSTTASPSRPRSPRSTTARWSPSGSSVPRARPTSPSTRR